MLKVIWDESQQEHVPVALVASLLSQAGLMERSQNPRMVDVEKSKHTPCASVGAAGKSTADCDGV